LSTREDENLANFQDSRAADHPVHQPDPADLFAPCGMNCLVCYAHLRKKKPCDGCLAADTHKTERCKSCFIKQCAQQKGLVYCFDCPDFPCQRIKNLEKSYLKRYQVSLIENSRLVQASGLEPFFQKERLRWACPECGGLVCLHDKMCSQCGQGSHSAK
jgi:hypothetical protein